MYLRGEHISSLAYMTAHDQAIAEGVEMDCEEISGSDTGDNKNLAVVFGVTALILFAIVNGLISLGATLLENALIAAGGIFSLGFGLITCGRCVGRHSVSA